MLHGMLGCLNRLIWNDRIYYIFGIIYGCKRAFQAFFYAALDSGITCFAMTVTPLNGATD